MGITKALVPGAHGSGGGGGSGSSGSGGGGGGSSGGGGTTARDMAVPDLGGDDAGNPDGGK